MSLESWKEFQKVLKVPLKVLRKVLLKVLRKVLRKDPRKVSQKVQNEKFKKFESVEEGASNGRQRRCQFDNFPPHRPAEKGLCEEKVWETFSVSVWLSVGPSTSSKLVKTCFAAVLLCVIRAAITDAGLRSEVSGFWLVCVNSTCVNRTQFWITICDTPKAILRCSRILRRSKSLQRVFKES